MSVHAFISACVDVASPDENERAMIDLAAELKAAGLEFVDVTGAYNGAPESSYRVGLSDLEQLELMLHLAAKYSQESILAVNDQSSAWLLFTSGRPPQALGIFKKVSAAEALIRPSYSRIGDDFYITVSDIADAS